MAKIVTDSDIGTGLEIVGGKLKTNLTKSDLGLGNVNNTSDVDKPVSTATASAIATSVNGLIQDSIVDGITTKAPSQNAVFDALALKAPLASPDLTGTPTAPTATAGTNTTQLATTAFVANGLNGKQDTLTNPITGSLTTNYLPKATGSTTLGDSLIYDNGTNVGMGTTSPSAKLHIEANGNGSGLGLRINTNTRAIGEDYIWFGDNSIPDFLVNTTGNVGIGTTSPSEKLTVTNGKLALTTEDVTIGGKIYGYNDPSLNLYSGGLKFQTRYYDGTNYAYADRLTINSSGNVGIGTTSPNYSSSGRQVVDINGTSQSMLALSVGGVGKGFLFYTGTDFLFSNETNGSIGFNANGDRRVTILPSGNVGIGTTSPTGILDVSSTTSGSLPFPRMTSAQRTDISSPPTGMHVYQTDVSEGLYVKESTGWAQYERRKYKVYTALLSQSGTGAPVATVLENTLGGTVVWSRNSVGNYTGTLANAFTPNKSLVLISPSTNISGNQLYSTASLSSCTILSTNEAGVLVEFNAAGTSIEIRVYN